MYMLDNHSYGGQGSPTKVENRVLFPRLYTGDRYYDSTSAEWWEFDEQRNPNWSIRSDSQEKA